MADHNEACSVSAMLYAAWHMATVVAQLCSCTRHPVLDNFILFASADATPMAWPQYLSASQVFACAGPSAATPSDATDADFISIFSSKFGPFSTDILQQMFDNRSLPFSLVSVMVQVSGEPSKSAYQDSSLSPTSASAAESLSPGISPFEGHQVNETILYTSIAEIASAVQELINPFVNGKAQACRTADAEGLPSAACEEVTGSALNTGVSQIVQVRSGVLYPYGKFEAGCIRAP